MEYLRIILDFFHILNYDIYINSLVMCVLAAEKGIAYEHLCLRRGKR